MTHLIPYDFTVLRGLFDRSFRLQDNAHICLYALLLSSTVNGAGNTAELTRVYKKIENVDPKTCPFINYVHLTQVRFSMFQNLLLLLTNS